MMILYLEAHKVLQDINNCKSLTDTKHSYNNYKLEKWKPYRHPVIDHDIDQLTNSFTQPMMTTILW